MTILDRVLKEDNTSVKFNIDVSVKWPRGRMIKVPVPVEPIVKFIDINDPIEIADFKYEYKWVEDD